MNQDCIDAQQTLSSASDGFPVTAEELKSAKVHCAACSECMAFISGLAALKKSPPPTAPAEIVTGVISAIRAEATAITERTLAAEKAAQEAEIVASSTADNVENSPLMGAATLETLELDLDPKPSEIKRDLGRYGWKGWGPWAGAAAAVFLVAGVITVRGVDYIASNSTTEDASSEVIVLSSDDELQRSEPPVSDEAVGESSATIPKSANPATGKAYITFDSWVYSYARPESKPDQTDVSGAVYSALDTEGPAQQYPAYPGPEPNTLIVFNGEDYLGFKLVTRELDGDLYGMRSEPVDHFGLWPSLPREIPTPTSPDGSPVFESSNMNSYGETVYVMQGTTPEGGFAIAPGTLESDPAEGNPYWTWWAHRP